MTNGAPLRILLVEDSADDFQRIGTLLRSDATPDCELTHAQTAAEAASHLRSATFDLVVTDLTLPDTSGLETFRRVKSHAAGTPVIVLTGIESDQVSLQAMEEGAQDYLFKSNVTAELLNRSIRYAQARHRADEALRESEERYSLAVAGSNNGVWDWDLRTNRVFYSARWKSLHGFRPDEIGDSPSEWLDRIHPEDGELVREKIHAHLDDLTSHFHAEYRMERKNGGWMWVLTRGRAVRDEHGVSYRIAGSHGDVTDRKRAEEQLIHNAFHDSLTGLPNRALLHDRLDRSLRRLRRGGGGDFAVIFLDLDRFKHINDSKGHEIGDRILVEFARRLELCIRPGDTVARLGGDEFVVLADDVDSAADARKLADRIHDQIAPPIAIGNEEYFTTVSIGIALSSTDYDLPEQVIRDADTAMYRAKAEGRSATEIFNKEMHDCAVAILQLDNDMRRALGANQFEIHYQPIVNLRTGRIRGFEALLRWNHPAKGLIKPEHFIPLAEETGLIVPLGWWVLEKACGQMRVWQDQFPSDVPLTMSVNISSRQFGEPDLVERVRSIIGESGIEHGSLVLEMTESVLMKDYHIAGHLVEELRSIGVQLHIDDFGTGYSSLSHLRHLPTESLKIDRSFIHGMMDSNENSEIVRTIISLARNLGMTSTAEGVETADQLARARSMDCEQGQGFFFSAPRDSDEIAMLMESNPSW